MKRYLITLLILFVLIIPAQAQEKIYLPLILKNEDSCMGIAKLAISDGTTEISLLDLEGIHLAEDDGWTPKIIQAKSGGVFQDSSMAAGRRLVYRQFGTAREDFTFNIMGISQDDLIAETSDLLQLLEKAVNYWATDWQGDIVYLIAQSDCETYARYAPILYYEAPELQNPYGQPFVQSGDGAIFDDIGIMIERGHWQSTIPGTGECVEASNLIEWGYLGEWVSIGDLAAISIYSLFQTNTGRLLAGANGDIWYSDDNGDNWAILSNTPVGIVETFMQSTTGRIFAGDNNGTVWYSDNDGGAWNVSTNLPASTVHDIIQTDSGRIIVTDSFRLLYSDNDGGAWGVLASSPSAFVVSLFQLDSGRIISGETAAIRYSDDNGNNWITANSSYLISSNNGTIQTDTGRIIMGVSGGLVYSDDNGITWTLGATTSGSFIYGLYYTTNGRIITGSNDIHYSDNDGYDLSYWLVDGINTYYDFIELANGRIIVAATGISSIYDSTTVTLSTDDTCENIIYVANKQNIANLTNIFIDDGGVFSSIFPSGVFPVDLLPAVPAVNDAVYFGINTSIFNSGPFSSLVFDLDSIIEFTNTYTMTWEYWNGAWVALTVQDGTNNGTGAFRDYDVNSVHWIQPSNWTTTAVNGVTGYWIRSRVSALAGTITPPSQQNRDIYSTSIGYIDIDNLDVLGDISALAQIKAQNRSDNDGPGGNAPNLYDNRLIVGLRSYNRGTTFQSYLNISDEQNPFGVTISVGTNTTIGTDIAAPTGRSATYNPGGVEAMATRATVTLSTTIARDFYGSYHAFLRVQRTAGASTDFDVQLVFVTGSGGIQKTTESKRVQTTTAFELLDFGQVTIPVGGSLSSSDLGDQIQVLIQASAASGTPNLVLYDLILIPVDEWAIDSVDQTNSSTSDIGRSGDISKLLDIDSVTDPKNPIKSIVRQVGSEFVTANYNPITNGPAILQSNVDQRLWFLAAKTSATGSSFTWISPPEITHSVQLFKAQRYLGLRGNR